jgi:hypothetical protein
MQSTPRLEEADVQVVWIDNVGWFEIVDGALIRCRRGADQTAMHTTAWTKEEEELVSHVLRTVPPHGMVVGCSFQEKTFHVQVTHPKRCWVLRRKDGSVYQIHPGHASAFARKRFEDLMKQEG